MSNYRSQFFLLWLVIVLAGCSHLPPPTAPAGYPQTTAIADVPYVEQDPYQCGPAALSMVLQYAGHQVDQQQLVQWVYSPDRKGSIQPSMITAVRRSGYLATTIHSDTQLVAELYNQTPVVVLQNLGLSWLPKWHYAVVTGIDLEQQTITLHTGPFETYTTGLQTFLRTWSRSNYWGMVVTPPGELPVSATLDDAINAGIGLSRSGFSAASNQTLNAIADRWPDSPKPLLALGNYAFSQASFEQANHYYLEALALAPEDAVLHNNTAQSFLELGNTKAALRHAEKAIQIGSDTFATEFLKTKQAILAAQ